MKVAVILLLLVAAAYTINAATVDGPYEDIQELLHSAAVSSAGLSALDHRTASSSPRVVEIAHHHHHLVPADMPAHEAERQATENTPAPPPVRIVSVPNQAQAIRHAHEDAFHASVSSTPTINTVDVQHTVHVHVPAESSLAAHIRGRRLGYTIKGQRGDTKGDKPNEVRGTGFHHPLVDRSLQRPRYAVVAELDGSHRGGDWKPHTAEELQAEAARLLTRAKHLQQKKQERELFQSVNHKGAANDDSLGVFDSKDEGYEDELTRLKRVSARMNRLLEQIQTPHNGDSFEGSIARKRYFLKIYKQLKSDATKIIEAYALRTGHSIFEMFGDGKIDPSIAAFLPPNSVAAILAQYANPTRGRTDETPRDIISGKDAKRIQYSIDYYRHKRDGTRQPLPPHYALTDEQEEAARRAKDPRYNKVIATQEGAFGQGRPAITEGGQALGRSSVHIGVVNPTETQYGRGMPYQVNLKLKRPDNPEPTGAALAPLSTGA